MTDNDTIVALLAIWKELPALTGERWEFLEQQLTTLLETFESTTDATVQARICIEIQQALETVPAALDLFDAKFMEIDPTRGSVLITRGVISSQIKQILRSKNQAPKKSARYTNISCPRRVWIKTPRISVVVRLNVHPSDFSEVIEKLEVSNEPVEVRIEAPGFKLLGPAVQSIDVVPAVDSVPLVFDLSPLEVTHTSISFYFIQAEQPVGTASFPVEITADEMSVINQMYTGPTLQDGEGINPPDFILYIGYESLRDGPRLHFRLRPKGDVLNQEFESVPLKVAPEVYATQIYRRLTALANKLDPTTHAQLKTDRSLIAQNIDDLLMQEGQNMWVELIPLELRKYYEREREQWKDKSLLIISDEPHIPWEFLWPHGTWGDDGPLCLLMDLARWLQRSPLSNTSHQPKQTLDLQSLAIIAPPDSGLLAAQRERSFLSAFVKQHGLHNVSPAEPTYAAVKLLLQTGGYTWMHVVAHGNFYPEDPDGESAIWLMDKLPLTSRSIVGVIANYLHEQRPGFFFNACEVGRQGWAITGLGGWASRLIGAGAGLFLAPMWVVNDRDAYKYCTVVYQLLLEGKTVAHAVRQGRLAAKRAGNPTWLSYSLYAHPNACVTR